MRGRSRGRPRRRGGLLVPGLLLGLLLGLGADPAREAGAQASEDATLVLVLCEGYVASADLVPPRGDAGKWAVAVRLMPDASEAFADLTTDHVGRTLEVRLGPEHVVRARIRGPIRSGVVTAGGYATREEAEAARTAALASRTRPCPAGDAPGKGAAPEPQAP